MISEGKGNGAIKLRVIEKRRSKCEEKDKRAVQVNGKLGEREREQDQAQKASEEKHENMYKQLKAAKYIGHRLRANM